MECNVDVDYEFNSREVRGYVSRELIVGEKGGGIDYFML